MEEKDEAVFLVEAHINGLDPVRKCVEAKTRLHAALKFLQNYTGDCDITEIKISGPMKLVQ